MRKSPLSTFRSAGLYRRKKRSRCTSRPLFRSSNRSFYFFPAAYAVSFGSAVLVALASSLAGVS